MTANGLDAVAEDHNDGLLCLDELGQAEGKEVGSIVYALANGSPKQRMTQGVAPGWSVLILSSGETSLADHMGAAGKHVRPGQQVRLCDLDADAGAGLGLFEGIHGFANPSAFARHLTDSARRYHGSPIRAFLRMLVEDLAAATRNTVGLRDQFLERYVPTEASGEVRRAASRFALVAAAGEMATAAGITGWVGGESMHGAKVCFDSWLSWRGNTTGFTAEIMQVRRFFETLAAPQIPPGTGVFGRNYFFAAGSPVAGFRLGQHSDISTYFVDPEVFRGVICAGFDPKVVLRNLKVHGLLEHDRGRLDKSVRLRGAGKKRMYAIKAGILDGRQTVPVSDANSSDIGDSGSELQRSDESVRAGRVALRLADSGDAGTPLTTDTSAENPGALEEIVERQLSFSRTDSRSPIGGGKE
jgi:putative DNA primase/helicase